MKGGSSGCGAGSRNWLPAAARVYDAAAGPVEGLVRFDWDALDWFEEDEQLRPSVVWGRG